MKVPGKKQMKSMSGESPCPFKIGDVVRFTPDERTVGWYQTGGFFGLEIGEVGPITRIDGNCVYLSDDRGGFHWTLFQRV